VAINYGMDGTDLKKALKEVCPEGKLSQMPKH
jgi:hypothetical protein